MKIGSQPGGVPLSLGIILTARGAIQSPLEFGLKHSSFGTLRGR